MAVAASVAVTIMAATSACSKDRTNAQVVPGSVRPGAPSTLARGPSGTLALDGNTTCDTIGRLFTARSVQITSYLRDTMLEDPMSERPGWRRGCRVELKDTVDTNGAPFVEIEKWLGDRHWIYATGFDADGPDGEVFGRVLHERLCVLRGSWDGGDDSDTTYIPKPGYEATIWCAPATPPDTVGTGERERDVQEMKDMAARQQSGNVIIGRALACPVPGGCGIAPPSVPPQAMIDLQRLISAARLRTTTWPAAGPLPLVDTVAKHGRAIARPIVAMLPTDSATVVEWNVHVEQQLELTLCAIYGVKPEAGMSVWGVTASQAANRAVRQYWRDRVRSGS